MQAACQGQLEAAFESEKTGSMPVNPEKTALQKSATTLCRRERAAPLASRRAIAWQKMTKNRACRFPPLAGELPPNAMLQVVIYTPRRFEVWRFTSGRAGPILRVLILGQEVSRLTGMPACGRT